MLTPSVALSYREAAERMVSIPDIASWEEETTAHRPLEGATILFEAPDSIFLETEDLRHEVFGPATVLVHCASTAGMLEVAWHLEVALTARNPRDPAGSGETDSLLFALERKAGD